MRMGLWASIVSLGLVGTAAGDEQERFRVLFLTQSVGYTHAVVKRPDPDTLSLAEQQFVQAAEAKYEVVCTQDTAALDADFLGSFVAVVSYTTGELPMSPVMQQELLDYVKRGGAFVGIHPATDTLYENKAYGEMVGAYFDKHPWHQQVRVKVENVEHPATAHLGDAFEITDEIYQFKAWDRRDVQVLLSLDVESVDLAAKHVHRTDKDFALAWCKPYGNGRVFYTALGHRPEVWKDERFLKHVVGGLDWALSNPRHATARDEEGFLRLFDQEQRHGWKQAGPGRFVIDDEGVATAEGGMGLWYYALDSYRNFILKLEFRQPEVATNSGVYVRFPRVNDDPWHPVREGYEIQIAGDKPSKNTTGSIYSFQAPTHIPLRPAGEWNDYEITCTGPRIYVRLNGELINEFEGDRSRVGMIGVQNHGHARDAISYRNIRVKPLPDAAVAYHVLFQGAETDLDHWRMCGPGAFFLEDGALVTEGGMGMLWHEQSFADFLLLLDWRVGRKQDNSGVFVRFPDPADDPWVAVRKGYEIQICDADPPRHRTGSVYSFADATEVPTHEVGAWNHYEIHVVGQRYRVGINGKQVNDFRGERCLEGHVGLQNHDPKSKVRFREIRVVELGGR